MRQSRLTELVKEEVLRANAYTMKGKYFHAACLDELLWRRYGKTLDIALEDGSAKPYHGTDTDTRTCVMCDAPLNELPISELAEDVGDRAEDTLTVDGIAFVKDSSSTYIAHPNSKRPHLILLSRVMGGDWIASSQGSHALGSTPEEALRKLVSELDNEFARKYGSLNSADAPRAKDSIAYHGSHR